MVFYYIYWVLIHSRHISTTHTDRWPAGMLGQLNLYSLEAPCGLFKLTVAHASRLIGDLLGKETVEGTRGEGI